MGCCASTTAVEGVARRSAYGPNADDTSSDGGLKSNRRVGPHDTNVPNLSLASSLTEQQLQAWSCTPIRFADLRPTKTDEYTLQHLAIEFGRDADGQPLPDFYLPQTFDLAKEDGSRETRILERIDDMEKEDLASDGRLTPEPSTFSCAVSSKMALLKAKVACRSHEIDHEELNWIARPPEPAVISKCVHWDGIYAVGTHLDYPGVLYQTSDSSSPGACSQKNSFVTSSGSSGRTSAYHSPDGENALPTPLHSGKKGEPKLQAPLAIDGKRGSDGHPFQIGSTSRAAVS